MQPELISDCVHCGFCLPTCPTYALWHEEMDSPRGRIYLMDGLVQGTIPLTDTVVEHFDRCLGCMACVTACPSGVQYDRLIEQTRHYVEDNHSRGPLERLLRAGIFAVFPHRRRLRAALLFRRLPAPGPLAPLKQIAPPWSSPGWPPEHLPGEGPRVALLAGCVQSVVFGDVNRATARVLQAEGFDVHVPRSQGCCGALHAHAGRLDEGVARARALVEALAGYDHIVTNAAGCGSHLQDHCSRCRARSGTRCRSGSPSRTRATCATRSGSRTSRARCSTRSPGSSGSSRPSRRSAAAAPASTTSSSRRPRRSSATARRAACSLRSRTRTRAGIRAASSR